MVPNQKKINIQEILNSLFIKEKVENGKDKLNNYIYQYITKNGRNNLEEFISNLLNSFKNELFDESKEYSKKLEKNIKPVFIIQNIIKLYLQDPNNYFILLTPLFEMYKKLDPEKIIECIKKIKELLGDKKEIILKNFNKLFEIIISLIINQDKSVREIGENLNNLLKNTLENSKVKLDDKKIFDFELFENIILEKTHINHPIIDEFLLVWINEICNIETLDIYNGTLFYDLMPWILKKKDASKMAIDCEEKLKNIFLNKYLKYYNKENNKIKECILLFIKLIKNKNISEVSKEYKFLCELIKHFINIIEENNNLDKSKNNLYDYSTTEVCASPIPKRKFGKLKYDIDIKKSGILFSPKVIFPKKARIMFDTNKNLSKSRDINSFDLSQESENKNNELFTLIPLDILNNIMELIIECNDISKEEELNKLNLELKNLIDYLPKNYEQFNAKEFVNTIIKGVEKPEIINKDYLFDWYQLFCEKYEQKINNQSITAIINSILKIIENQEQDILKNQSLIILMFEKLKKLNLKGIFCLLSDSLNKIKKFSLIYQIDGHINYYLITTQRAEEFIKELIIYGKNRNKEKRELYEKIFRMLAYNPMCLLIFCTITEYYELSWNLILNFYKIKFKDNYYVHLSEFIQLMENTKSNHIRILLLHPEKNIYLVKTLYGILMLLPQGKAYNILSDRLYSIKGLFKYTKEIDSKIEHETMDDINYFINIFIEVYQRKKEK